MSYRNMDAAGLARWIGMDPREVRRLAERGVLPAQQVGGDWRFNAAQMLDWLQRELHSLEAVQIRNLEEAMTTAGSEAAFVSPLLALERIELDLRAKSRASVLRELVALADRSGALHDAAGLIAACEEREALASTALTGGIALPHPRRPLAYATARPLLCLGRVPAGVPYGAPDGRLTDLFVLVCSHDDREHIRTLARLAGLLSTELPDALRECATPDEALSQVVAAELRLLRERGGKDEKPRTGRGGR
jgi:PTS system nitrogen regulatory IIA component